MASSRRRTSAVRRSTREGSSSALPPEHCCHLDAVEAGQPVVHDDDVGIVIPAELDDVVAVLDRGDDLDVRPHPEEHLESLAEDSVVLDEGDADRYSAFSPSPALRQWVQA